MLEDVKPILTAAASNPVAGSTGANHQPFNMYEAFLNRKESSRGGGGPAAPAAASAAAASSGGAAAAAADSLEESGTFEASGVRPRKPCNCTKSQCLKL